MILVVEGPSAAGKSTWVARWPARFVVPETGRVQPRGCRRFTTCSLELHADLNCARWSLAIAVRAGDGHRRLRRRPAQAPLRLLPRANRKGLVEQFRAGAEATRSAIAGELLGIADVILCCVPDAATLDRHRRADAARARRNFAAPPRIRACSRRLVPHARRPRPWSGDVGVPGRPARTRDSSPLRSAALRRMDAVTARVAVSRRTCRAQ